MPPVEELNLGAGADEDELVPLEFEPPDEPPEEGAPFGLYVPPTGAALLGVDIAKGLFGAVAIFGAVGFATPLCAIGLTGVGFATLGAVISEGFLGVGFCGTCATVGCFCKTWGLGCTF